MKRYLSILLVLVCVCFATSAIAQSPTGAIEGQVVDPTGAVVKGATVTVTEKATNRNFTVTTTDEGFYSVRSLPPGVYSVKVEQSGFSTANVETVTVQVGQVARADIGLQVGQQSETVQIAVGETETQVDTTRQTVDGVITGRQITNLPLNERNFLDLAALQPGVTVVDGDNIDPTKVNAFRAVRVNGGSGTGTRVQIDGIDVTDESVGTTVANVSTDAVQEFQLSRSSFDLSTSLTTSGAVSIATRSGGNDFRGSAFYFAQDDRFDARPDFETVKPEFNRKQYGYRFGGPFLKNRLFFFSNFERLNQNNFSTATSLDFPGQNASGTVPVKARLATNRLDWNVTDRVKLFYSHNFNDDSSTATNATGNLLTPFQNVDWTNTHVVAADITGSRITHSVRFGHVNFNNRIESSEFSDFPFLRTPQGVAFNIQVGDLVRGPNGLAPQQTYQNNYQFKYDGSYTISNHVLRYGGEINKIILGGFANFAGPLTLFGDISSASSSDPLDYSLSSFTTGPNAGFFTARPAHNLPYGGKFNTRYAWYVGDNWKVSRRLTLNLGVRYNYESNFFASKDVPELAQLERYGAGRGKAAKFPKNAFSPQVGFAYDLFGDGKTSVRGGFYLAYEANIFNNSLFDELGRNASGIGPTTLSFEHIVGPNGAPINIGAIPGCSPAEIAQGNYTCLEGRSIRSILPYVGQIHQAVQAAYANISGYNPRSGASEFQNTGGVTFGGQIPGDYRIPYSLQFNIGFQRELLRGHVLSVDFVKQRTIGLPLLLVDAENRRDSRYFNEASARARISSVTGIAAANINPATIQTYLNANPSTRISAFSLANDVVFPGQTSDVTRARLLQGGFLDYSGLQVSLNGRFSREKFEFLQLGGKDLIRGFTYTVGYALSRLEGTNGSGRPEFFAVANDNRNPNSSYGPTGLDRKHNLTVSASIDTIGGFRFDNIFRFSTPTPLTLFVPQSGGANALFTADINGDGSNGGGVPRPDVLPGTGVGDFGRKIRSLRDLNRVLSDFNANVAGRLTPAGQRFVDAGIFSEAQMRALGAVVRPIALIPEGNPNPFENLFRHDVRISRPVRIWKETWSLEPSLSIFNVFNNSPRNQYGGLDGTCGSLNFDYSAEPANDPTRCNLAGLDEGRGLQQRRRQLQFGIRFSF